MTEVQLPETSNVSGVFLLTPDDLKELDAILDKAKKEITREVRRQLTKTAEAEVRDNQKYTSLADKSVEEVKLELKSRYPFNIRTHVVSVTCKSGKTIKGGSFEQVITSPEMQHEKPIRTAVEIRYAGITLSVALFSHSILDPEVQIDCSPRNQAFAHRVVKSITDWAESKRKYVLWSRVRWFLPFAGFMLLVTWMFTAPLGLVAVSSGKATLVQKAYDLSRQGISSTNQGEAIDILLRLTTNNYEGAKVVGVRGWWLTLLPLAVGTLLCGLLCPRSVVGIGRGYRMLAWYRLVGRYLYIIFGVLIFAILTSALGSWLYDLWKVGIH